MATKKGIWNLQQVRDKQLQSLWSYSGELTLFTWGMNGQGELGHNNRTDYSSPTQIAGATWVKGSGTAYNSAAIKTDGTLWVMGENYNRGGLGQNDGVTRSSPVQVPGTTWSEVDVGATYFMAAVKTDGTLWTWGGTDTGALGHNNRTKYSSPVQVGSGTDWGTDYNQFHLAYTSAGVKTDGTLWMSGINGKGTLGQNSVTYSSSPVQVPGNWQEIGILGGTSIIAIKKV